MLQHALQVDKLECSYRDLLVKTLFLVAMASAARVSEITALSRDDLHVSFNAAGEAILRHNKPFLAKNESWIRDGNPGQLYLC